MKNYLFVATVLLLGACGSKDQQFCDCLEAGDALNSYSKELFQQEMTQIKADKLKKLKAVKKAQCADYQTMTGEEMLKRKTECN
jgi:hypothetical protein